MGSNQSIPKQNLVDEFTKTQPILETLLFEIRCVATDIKSVKEDIVLIKNELSNLRGQTNLAGNLAGEAADNANEALSAIKETREIVRRIDSTLLGVSELAKSGFDIATAAKMARQNRNDDETYFIDPEITIEDGNYKFQIAGTGN